MFKLRFYLLIIFLNYLSQYQLNFSEFSELSLTSITFLLRVKMKVQPELTRHIQCSPTIRSLIKKLNFTTALRLGIRDMPDRSTNSVSKLWMTSFLSCCNAVSHFESTNWHNFFNCQFQLLRVGKQKILFLYHATACGLLTN